MHRVAIVPLYTHSVCQCYTYIHTCNTPACTEICRWVEGLEFRIDNHNSYKIEFLDYRTVRTVLWLIVLARVTFNLAIVPQPYLQISVC